MRRAHGVNGQPAPCPSQEGKTVFEASVLYKNAFVYRDG